MITKKKLKKFSKEELIQLCLLRNNDAKDYSKALTELKEKKDEFVKKIEKRMKKYYYEDTNSLVISLKLFHWELKQTDKEVFG